MEDALKVISKSRYCLAQCFHCRITFITVACNQERANLGCPMGCRQKQCRKGERERSRDYYQSEEGKTKKKWLNQRRNLGKKKKAEEEEDEQHPLYTRASLIYLLFLGRAIVGPSMTITMVRQMVNRAVRRLRQLRRLFQSNSATVLGDAVGRCNKREQYGGGA